MCGHHAALMYHWGDFPGSTDGLSPEHCYVECQHGDCGVSLDQDLDEASAIKLWNTRAPSPDSRAASWNFDLLKPIMIGEYKHYVDDGTDSDGNEQGHEELIEWTTIKDILRDAIKQPGALIVPDSRAVGVTDAQLLAALHAFNGPDADRYALDAYSAPFREGMRAAISAALGERP
jgi:hypothetical protein